MSDIIKGRVTNIRERETSVGTMYDLEINGKSYGAGKYAPKAKVGQYVKFPAKYNGKYANVGGRIEVISESEAGPAPAAASSGGGGGGRSYQANDDKRQEIISRQAARNTAVAFMQILADKDAIPLPASAKTPAQRFEVLNTFLDGLTVRFNDFALGKTTGDEDVNADDGEEDGSDEDFT
jgi:hypothetical protein